VQNAPTSVPASPFAYVARNYSSQIATTSHPACTSLSIRLIDGERTLSHMRWGLIPFWSKDASIGYKMIKARAEPAATKPAFRAADKALRCLISAPGCEAWKWDVDPKLPHYLPKRDDSPIGFAGL
jgi:putative SOS response-associated peptidase YedK